MAETPRGSAARKLRSAHGPLPPERTPDEARMPVTGACRTEAADVVASGDRERRIGLWRLPGSMSAPRVAADSLGIVCEGSHAAQSDRRPPRAEFSTTDTTKSAAQGWRAKGRTDAACEPTLLAHTALAARMATRRGTRCGTVESFSGTRPRVWDREGNGSPTLPCRFFGKGPLPQPGDERSTGMRRSSKHLRKSPQKTPATQRTLHASNISQTNLA